MSAVVIAGGPDIQIQNLMEIIKNADEMIAADSGAAYLQKAGVFPTLLLGDMDSISKDTLHWIQKGNVPTQVFPIEKDMTDAELCLREVKSKDILFISSLGGRPDHAFMNLLMTARLKEEGKSVTLTDGSTWVYALKGPCEFSIPPERKKGNPVISLFPMFKEAKEVTTFGLQYPLHRATLYPGSSFSVSNGLPLESRGEFPAGISFEEGVILFFLTPPM